MPRFFVRQDQISDTSITILGEDAHHIGRSLRMAVGDALVVCDMQGNEYDCQVDSFDGDREVVVRILQKKHSENEPPCVIRLFQALPKGDKLDSVIQKAVECGVSEIIPFESERCVVKMKADGEERKNERRAKIAAEAAKQCGRSVLPPVHRTVRYAEMLRMATESELCLFCYEGEGTHPIGAILNAWADRLPESISIVIGSEGGFSIAEAEAAKALGVQMTGLGKRILRTETASTFVLSCIAYATELQNG